MLLEQKLPVMCARANSPSGLLHINEQLYSPLTEVKIQYNTIQ